MKVLTFTRGHLALFQFSLVYNLYVCAPKTVLVTAQMDSYRISLNSNIFVIVMTSKEI